jgi:hypothetical protein
MPSLANTASKTLVNLLSRSVINTRELSCAVAEVHQKIPRLLGHPGAAGVGGDSQEVNATARVLHYEQHVQPLQQQGLDAEEIGGENAAGLYPQELSPAGPVAARGGSDAGSFENRPHGTGHDQVAQPGEFAVDASITCGARIRDAVS